MYLAPISPLNKVKFWLLSNSPYGKRNPALQKTGLAILHSTISKFDPLAVVSIKVATISPFARLVELELEDPDLLELELILVPAFEALEALVVAAEEIALVGFVSLGSITVTREEVVAELEMVELLDGKREELDELTATVVSRLRLLKVALRSQTENIIRPTEMIATMILVMLEVRFSI